LPLPAFRRAPDWPHAVHDTQEAMFASAPNARLGGVEISAVAPGHELEPDTPPIAAEAIGGALYSLLHDHVYKKARRRCRTLFRRWST
jgi:hypothetical protein